MRKNLVQQKPTTETLKLSAEFLKANEEKYVAFRWLDLKAFTQEELLVMEQMWKPIPQLVDFWPSEQTCCFKFKMYSPVTESQMKYVKELNEKNANHKMRELSNVMKKYGYYLNPAKLKITKVVNKTDIQNDRNTSI